MGQNNSEWETIIDEYRQILLSLRKILLGMKRRYEIVFEISLSSTEAHQCRLKLLSTFKEYNSDYKSYAIECGRYFISFDQSTLSVYEWIICSCGKTPNNHS